jgi:hypothetical protein
MKTIPLKQLATKIKAEHEQVVQTVRKSLGHAKKAGELLAKAQKEVQKTTALKWGRWVEQECGIRERTASNYIRLSEVIPWGRSFEEYRRMFALTDEDLAGRILASRGLGVDGAWSFLPRAVAHPLFP